MHISRIDQALYTLIKEVNVNKIDIKARFNTSVSGYSNNYFITILNDTKELLPMSIVLSGKIDDLYLCNNRSLTISENKNTDLFFDGRTAIEDLYVYKEDRINLNEKILVELKKFLVENASKEFFFSLLSKTNILRLPATKESGFLGNEHFFLDNLVSFLICLIKGDLTKAPNIIGFGLGLTPSSDDFLLGLLSVFLFTGDKRSKSLAEYISLFKEGTTEVSKWMLHYASTNRLFPIIIKRFFQEEGKNTREFLSHGGTSGIDLLCGIYTGLYLIFEEIEVIGCEGD